MTHKIFVLKLKLFNALWMLSATQISTVLTQSVNVCNTYNLPLQKGKPNITLFNHLKTAKQWYTYIGVNTEPFPLLKSFFNLQIKTQS